MILEKLTITDTFKQWRDKINAIVDEYEGVPSTDKNDYVMTIDTDRTQAESLVVDVPSTFNKKTSFTGDVSIAGELDAVANSAKKLQNPIQLNGTLFDGSKDVVTNNWGVMNDIYIADYSNNNIGKLTQVNGSEGQYIFSMPETFEGYLDGDAKYALNLKTFHTIDGVSFDGGADVTHYGECSTDAGIQVKSVDIPNFVLVTGATVTVRFLKENTSGNPQLNVSNTGAKPIYFKDKPIEQLGLVPYSTHTFVYDGINYNVVTGVDNTVLQNITSLDREYPLLASPITNNIGSTTTSLFTPNIVINPSKNSITSKKFIANINNDNPSAFFVTKNTSESYNSANPSTSTYVRYVSYEDNTNHILSCLEYQKNNDGSKYSNIVVPKFTSTGNETAHSVLQVGWNATGNEQVNCNGSLYVQATATINGNLIAKANVDIAGDFSASRVYNAVWNDYAEFFEKGEETEAGDIVALDETSKTERYIKATNKSKLVVGVHSNTYGHILGGDGSIEESEKTHIPVGISGRVYVKFIGEAVLGEAVVPSEIPGVGCLFDETKNRKEQIVGYIVEDREDTLEQRKVKILIR